MSTFFFCVLMASRRPQTGAYHATQNSVTQASGLDRLRRKRSLSRYNAFLLHRRMIGHDDYALGHKPISPNQIALWDLSPTNALPGARLQRWREGRKLPAKLRRFRLVECHGLPNGVEEDVVIKRL